MRNTKSLTIKEKKIVKGLVSGMTAKDSLISAGYSESTALARGKDIIGKERIQRAILQAMAKLGLDEDYLIGKHKELMDCQKVVPIGAGDYVETVDGQTQVKALELAYKLRGDFSPELHAVVTETYGQRIKRLRGESDK
jgi:Terminase small subunit